jgi:hypothetical protein
MGGGAHMSYGLIGLYGLYFVFVGIHGNAGKLVSNVSSDAKNFLPWVLAILVLRAMYESDTLRPMVKPFIGLAALTFVLKNYGKVVGQINQIMPANVQLKT